MSGKKFILLVILGTILGLGQAAVSIYRDLSDGHKYFSNVLVLAGNIRKNMKPEMVAKLGRVDLTPYAMKEGFFPPDWSVGETAKTSNLGDVRITNIPAGKSPAYFNLKITKLHSLTCQSIFFGVEKYFSKPPLRGSLVQIYFSPKNQIIPVFPSLNSDGDARRLCDRADDNTVEFSFLYKS